MRPQNLASSVQLRPQKTSKRPFEARVKNTPTAPRTVRAAPSTTTASDQSRGFILVGHASRASSVLRATSSPGM